MSPLLIIKNRKTILHEVYGERDHEDKRAMERDTIFNIRSMSEFIRGPMAEQRYVATLLGAFAVLALFMSSTGVYTVVTYLVARRTREIAVSCSMEVANTVSKAGML